MKETEFASFLKNGKDRRKGSALWQQVKRNPNTAIKVFPL